MNESALVGVLQTECRLADVVAGLGGGEGANLADQALQVLAVHILHAEEVGAVGFPRIEGEDNVGVMQLPGRPHFLVKPADRLGMAEAIFPDDLEGNDTAHVLMLGFKHLTHAALAQPIQKEVGPDTQLLAAALRQLAQLKAREPAALEHLASQWTGIGNLGFGEAGELFQLGLL